MVHIITCGFFTDCHVRNISSCSSSCYGGGAEPYAETARHNFVQKVFLCFNFSENPNLTKLVLSGKKTPWNDVLGLMLPSIFATYCHMM